MKCASSNGYCPTNAPHTDRLAAGSLPGIIQFNPHSKLLEIVAPPVLQGAILQQRAGMVVTCRQRPGRTSQSLNLLWVRCEELPGAVPTPHLTRPQYLLGKWLSNLAFLTTLVAILVLAAVFMPLVQHEAAHREMLKSGQLTSFRKPQFCVQLF